MTTLNVNPDANPETDSVDGTVKHEQANLSWAQIIAAAGSSASDAISGGSLAKWQCDTNTDKFKLLHRSIFLFDTSALPDDCVITSARLTVYGYTKLNEGSWANLKLNVYASAPASETALAAGDFDSLGSTPLCDTDLDYDDFDSGNGANTFALNADGLAAISKTGITKLGLREVTYDVGGASPTWVTNKRMIFNGYFADKSGDDYPPVLSVTYADLPTVTQAKPSNIQATVATGHGNITSVGDGTVSQHGHCWNRTGTPTTSDSKTELGAASAVGAFTSDMTDLQSGQRYYVRSYAINEAGTSYSSTTWSFIAGGGGEHKALSG